VSRDRKAIAREYVELEIGDAIGQTDSAKKLCEPAAYEQQALITDALDRAREALTTALRLVKESDQ
jgi:hypothetical protein